MPIHFHRTSHRREQNQPIETSATARSSTTGHFLNHLIELDHRVATQIGDDGARFGLHVDNFGRLFVGRPAGRGAHTRARERQG